MRSRTEPFPRHAPRAAWVLLILALGFALCPAGAGASQTRPDRRPPDRLEEARRKEGEALLELVDGAMRGRKVEPDFSIAWRNDFFKAQPGTFVPFTVTVAPGKLALPSALVYVRAVSRDPAARARDPNYAFEAVFPVDVPALVGQPLRVTRGFAVPPGDYDVYVAIRERSPNPLSPDPPQLKAAVLKQPIAVPDFWTTDLTASTVMLAERIDELPQPLAPERLLERPYAIGAREVQLAAETAFRTDRELIVVFLIYNPAVKFDRQFDVQVDYHLYRRGGTGASGEAASADHPEPRPGERYVTRTRPQRFNPATMGSSFDPQAGTPVLAGQGILLSSFQAGEYRLGITVRDLVSQKTLTRDVSFTVVGS